MRIMIMSLILLCVLGITYSQIDPLGDIFLDKQPIWSHVAIDTSAIGYKGRTGMDYYNRPAENKLLIHDNSIYIVYKNSFEAESGSFIEKIDLASGRSIWKNSFDLRHSTKREYTNRFYINGKNQLELLNFRYSYDTVDLFFPKWDGGKLSIRKFDANTGEEIYKYHSPIEDINFPLFKTQDNIYSYLTNNEFGGYDCYTNYYNRNVPLFGAARTRLDSIGRFIDIISAEDIYGKYKNINPYIGIVYPLDDKFDTIVRLIHSFQNKPFISGDTAEISLYFNNINLTQIKHIDLEDSVSKIRDYALVYSRDNCVALFGTEYFEDRSYPRQHLIVVSTDGQTVEEITYPQRINSSFGKFIGLVKLKNEPGVLICNKIATALDSLSLAFYKSDGNGNLSLYGELKMRDYYNMVIEAYMYELEDEKIIFSGLFRQLNLDIGDFQKTERFITSLWDLKTISNGDDNYKIHGIKVFPNPAKEYIVIENGMVKPLTYTVNIYNQIGDLVLTKNTELNENDEISISGLANAMHYINIIDNSNRLIYLGKFLKISN